MFIGYKSNDTIKENDFSLTTKQVEDNIYDSKKNEEIITNENSINDKYTDNVINDEFIENIALEEEELTSYDKENITIKNGKIYSLNQPNASFKTIDLHGAYVIPGFIDAHFHLK